MLKRVKKIIPKKIKKSFKHKLAKNHAQRQQKAWEKKYGNSPKIFGIGNNKTGTTSLEKAMRDFGYKVGEQRHSRITYIKNGLSVRFYTYY